VAALGQNGPSAAIASTGDGNGVPASLVELTAEQPQVANCPEACLGQPRCTCWTASAEFIILQRIGTSEQTLVTTYPGVPSPQTQYIVGQGTERLSSSDLTQGFAGGPKIGLLRHDESGFDLELTYFQIDGWNHAASIPSGPDTTPVMVAPGGFVQTTDNANQTMDWAYATRLYQAEANLRWEFCPRATMLAGFRWVGLREELEGTIPDPHRHAPFWETTTRNNLFGVQLGEEWKIVRRGRLSIDGLVKGGIFNNIAKESTGVSIFRTVHRESDSTTHAAFLGEIGLQGKYQVAERLVLKAGYEALWLEGVATAPGQIPQTLSHASSLFDVDVRSLGVDSSSGVFYHGATAGLEYTF
jgi:hypothetical protein